MRPADSARPISSRRQLLLHSVWSGLCPLIPIPFLDDWVLDKVRVRLVDELARAHGVALDEPAREVLARDPEEERRGCLGGCVGLGAKVAVSLVVRLVRKLFRKIVFVLALKDAVDAASATFHRGWLLDRALQEGELDRTPPRRISAAVAGALRAVDPRLFERAVRRTFSGRRKVLARAARHLARDLRQEGRPLARDEEVIGPLVDELESELRDRSGELERLEVVYRRFLRGDALAGRPVPPGDDSGAGNARKA